MANILGLHFAHDGGACVVKGNKLITAISSERITRKKKFYGITTEVINYVLSAASLTIDDIDVVAFTDYFTEHSRAGVTLYRYGEEAPYFAQAIFGNNIITDFVMDVNGKKIQAIGIPHHLAHCASSFYTSNFESCFCFSLDASTGYRAANSLVAYGEGNKLTAAYCPGLMIGNCYGKFTWNLGIGDALYKAGSTMGLASYGKPLDSVVKNIDSYVARSFFSKDMEGGFDKEFDRFWQEISGQEHVMDPNLKDSRRAMNIASSVQYIFEESILAAIKTIENKDNLNLCLSGGSMLNCNINSRILKESQFKNLHLFPACGDDGLVVGACLYVAHSLFNEPRNKYSNQDICYLGRGEDLSEQPDLEYIAQSISKNKIVAWFQGGSEYGPRALGHRSILADPRNFHNREILNFVIKKREWFRPFAPVVLEEKCSEWFDFDAKSPFMLFTAPVKNAKDVPAIVHVDNTARMQTINKETNPEYYSLVKAFDDITNIPMLINTSLNGTNEPILETEDDARAFFQNTPIDMLVLNGKIYEK